MGRKLIQIGKIQEHWNVSDTRVLKYSVEMYHMGLKEHKLISAPGKEILDNKLNLQSQKWTEKWEKTESKRQIQEEKEGSLEEANIKTEEAKIALKHIDDLLVYTLSIDNTVDWNSLKKKEKFLGEKPAKPEKKPYRKFPMRPDKNSSEFIPQFTFFEKLIKSKRERKIQEFEQKYLNAIKDWEKQKQSVKENNAQIDKEYDDMLKKWESAVDKWKKRKEDFYKKRDKLNAKIDKTKQLYLNKNENSIIEYCEIVLNNSEYPDIFPKNFELEYNPKNKIR